MSIVAWITEMRRKQKQRRQREETEARRRILTCLLTGAELSGRYIRATVFGEQMSRMAFYRLMAGLERDCLVAGWYEDSESVRVRRYKLTDAGRDEAARRMACETCGHTMGYKVTDRPFFWCPRCGTIKPCEGSEAARPLLVDRCRNFEREEVRGHVGIEMLWNRYGIRESINVEANREAH